MVSVIIPIFNAERYLKKTVQSVLDQDYKDYEVILVDDGSTDGSVGICDELASEYLQVTAIHKPNGGVSSARNAGIDVAKGEYLIFVDADDSIDHQMLGDLVKELERNNSDKVFCGYEEIHEDGVRIEHIANLPSRECLGRDKVVNTLLFTGCSGNSYMNSVWGGMYKTNIIKIHKLRFESRPMGEDWLFNMRYCDLIQSVVYIDKPYYKYLRNNSSATSRYIPQQFELWLENRTFRNSLVEKYKLNVNQNSVDSFWISNVLFYSLQVIRNDSNYKKKLIGIFRNIEFAKALNNCIRISPKYFVPVAWLLRKSLFNIAIGFLKLYSWRFNK